MARKIQVSFLEKLSRAKSEIAEGIRKNFPEIDRVEIDKFPYESGSKTISIWSNAATPQEILDFVLKNEYTLVVERQQVHKKEEKKMAGGMENTLLDIANAIDKCNSLGVTIAEMAARIDKIRSDAENTIVEAKKSFQAENARIAKEAQEVVNNSRTFFQTQIDALRALISGDSKTPQAKSIASRLELIEKFLREIPKFQG